MPGRRNRRAEFLHQLIELDDVVVDVFIAVLRIEICSELRVPVKRRLSCQDNAILLNSAAIASLRFVKREKEQFFLTAREAFMTIIVLAAWTDNEKAVDKNR